MVQPTGRYSLPLVVALSLVVSGCGGDGDGTGPTDSPAGVTSVGSQNVSGTVGELIAAALQVIVTNQAGAPAPGVQVAWNITSGGGSVSAASSTTDQSGVAQTQWTPGPTAGAQTVTATVSGVTPVTFTAQADPGPFAALGVTPASATLDALGASQELTAQPMDAFGNALPASGDPDWASDDEDVATVDEDGLVTAQANGEATITAT